MASPLTAARYLDRPALAPVPVHPRSVNLLALAREMQADAQLHDALRVSGTALLGVAADGVPLLIRLASPDVTHVLISGAKASGKTELIRTILASLALFQKPRELQFVVIASKPNAFEFLAHTPHLLGDPASSSEYALQHLRWLETELERREQQRVARPRLVVAVDDAGAFLAEGGREFQVHLSRLAQRGRTVGISLLLSAHKANGSELNGALRANFPVRLAGKNSGAEGADKLAGRGDFILNAGGERVRFQAAYLASADLALFYTRVRENHSRQESDAGLNGFMKRLRRVK